MTCLNLNTTERAKSVFIQVFLSTPAPAPAPVDNHIYKVCESTCHDCSTKCEVENYKGDSVVRKADLIIKKDMEHKEIIKEKENMKMWSPEY